jgi:HSP20 family protein
MFMPTLFDRDFFDDFFDDPFFNNKDMRKLEKKMYGHRAENIMKTDVKEKDDAYEMKVELPGFKKENIKVSLEDGYLTIYAEKGNTDENEGKFLRRERYAGACKRTFYVGDEIHEDQIKAEFKHGVLKIDLPKKVTQPEIEENKYIAIE